MTFEPQCKTRADLHREWARVLDMCEAANVSPDFMYKYVGAVSFREPIFTKETHKYEFPIAIVEGKPVFRGDDGLYWAHTGESFDWRILQSRHPIDWSNVTRTPPKPKTVTINGMEVKAPDVVLVWDGSLFYEARARYINGADAEAFKAALEGKK